MSIKKYSHNFCLIILFLLTQALTANTILVTSTLDAGAGTLRAAVTAANPGDTIGFDPLIDSTQITLTSGRITLSQNIVI
ncbi:MAG: hypothetical protein HKN76_09090, partial [Saprospiraceae bacterium]|nr:hypothetical protein [Saprospiraceae bacterium]